MSIIAVGPSLSSAPIQRLLAQNRESGYDAKTDYNISSMAKICEIYTGARLDDALFVYLMDPVPRERLRAVLVQLYFAPGIQPEVFFIEDTYLV